MLASCAKASPCRLCAKPLVMELVAFWYASFFLMATNSITKASPCRLCAKPLVMELVAIRKNDAYQKANQSQFAAALEAGFVRRTILRQHRVATKAAAAVN